MDEQAKIWIGTGAGTISGLITGGILVAVLVPGSDWIKPEVIGPAGGAFAAAMVGVAGVIWTRLREEQHRRYERQEAEKKAAISAQGVLLEAIGALLMLREEITYGRTSLRIRPLFVNGLQYNIKEISADVRKAADLHLLESGFVILLRNIARTYGTFFGKEIFPDIDESKIDNPMHEIDVPAGDLPKMEQVENVLGEASQIAFGLYVSLEHRYKISDTPPDKIREEIHQAIQKTKSEYFKSFGWDK